MDQGPFPGVLGKLWKGVGGRDLRSLLSGKGGALPASLCSPEALCPLGDHLEVPQCSCQALGIHAPKGHQAEVAPALQWCSVPLSLLCQTAQWTLLLCSAFVSGAQASREEDGGVSWDMGSGLLATCSGPDP